MKILVTSGGTKIPIDTVRSITNMSHGTLGSRMAKEFLEAGNEVIFFKAKGSKSPASITVDLTDGYEVGDFAKWFNKVAPMMERYREVTYVTFEDYAQGLKDVIEEFKPDMVVLCAAVSDYAPEEVMEGKIRTKDNLSINLKPLPKVISSVREWAGDKAIIVGFKLLVDVPAEELVAEAFKSIEKNRLDYVCANDLRTLLNGNHEIWLCDLDHRVEKVSHTELTKTLLENMKNASEE